VSTLRIAYVSTYPPTPCGIAEYTGSLVRAIRGLSSLDLSVLADDIGGFRTRMGVEMPVIPVFTPGKPCYGRLLKAAREHGPFDLIHIQHEYGLFRPTVRTLEAFRRLKKYCGKLMVTMHTVVGFVKRKVAEHQEKLCKLADAIIVHSILQEYELLSQGVNPSKVQRIPHGTTIAGFSELDPGEALERLGLPNLKGKFLFASLGFIRRDKGQDALIRAFKKVHERNPDTALIIAGVPQRKTGIKQASKLDSMRAADDGDDIIMLRRYLTNDEIDLLLRAANVVVFSYKERPGLWSVSGAFHKTIGSFKPVICSKVPRLAECSMVAPDLVVPPDNVEALAEKMMAAVTSYEEFAEKSKPLTELALSTSWRKIAESHLSLYQRLLGEHRVLMAKTVKPGFI
jgi:glycosyltransferase involved in cell wall biosynthesis